MVRVVLGGAKGGARGGAEGCGGARDGRVWWKAVARVGAWCWGGVHCDDAVRCRAEIGRYNDGKATVWFLGCVRVVEAVLLHTGFKRVWIDRDALHVDDIEPQASLDDLTGSKSPPYP